MSAEPRISVILATHNRRDVTLATITRVLSCSTPRLPLEVIAVDNASTDGTADAIQQRFGEVVLVRLKSNRGACAKVVGVPRARGTFVVFLDDDSYPRPGSLERMVEHFQADPLLGAAGFRVHLPDGSQESCALPDVFVGCGVGFRAEALRGVGGPDADLFMAAEEYHLAFRLVNAGWTIRVFDDLHVDHLKTPRARRSGRLNYYDTRNNLLLAARYLPAPWHAVYANDWRQRYGWLAAAGGHRAAFLRGWLAGAMLGRWDRLRAARPRLSPAAMETLFRLDFVADRMREIRAGGVRRIVLADLGKNVFAYYHGALDAGVIVQAIGDDHFAAAGRCYRGVPILPLEDALALAPDAVVVANMSPVHADRTRRRLQAITSVPAHDWFAPGEHPSPHPGRDIECPVLRS